MQLSDSVTLQSYCANLDRQTSDSALSSVQPGHEAGIALMDDQAIGPHSWETPGPEEIAQAGMKEEAHEPKAVRSKRARKIQAKQAEAFMVKSRAPKTRQPCTEVQHAAVGGQACAKQAQAAGENATTAPSPAEPQVKGTLDSMAGKANRTDCSLSQQRCHASEQ